MRGGAERDRLLVVDDDPYLADLLVMGLRHEGFEVERAGTGTEALEKAATTGPDLLVLDIMLPDLDGIEVCRRLRAIGDDVPVLFLTARDATDDKLVGLAAGADDYLTKPFSIAELVARVHAVLRRTRAVGGRSGNRLSYANLAMDVDARAVRRDGQLIELTATEFELLRVLLVNAERVLTKQRLLEIVWNYDFGGNPNVVETYISYLRHKLDPLGPPLIQTVRGVGYVLRRPREAAG